MKNNSFFIDFCEILDHYKAMEFLKKISPLFTTGIFFIGFLALLLAGFNAMLKPIERDILRLEAGQVKLEAGLLNLDKRMDGLEGKIVTIESKLDQLLAKP